MLSRSAASKPGRLRLRLTLERAVTNPDGAGGRTLAWAALATVAADVTPMRAEARQSGEGLADATTHRIVIRHRGDVQPGDRFRAGERLFAIRSITDPDEDGRYLVCLADEEARS